MKERNFNTLKLSRLTVNKIMHAAVCTKIYSNKTNNYFRVDKCKTLWE